MYYIVVLFVGLLTGAACLFLCLMDWARKIKDRERAAQQLAKRTRDDIDALGKNQVAFTALIASKEAELREGASRLDAMTRRRNEELYRTSDRLEAERAEFEQRVVSYKEIQDENAILKRDLQNIDVNLRKLELDGELRDQRQAEIDARSVQLAKRYLAETVKAVVSAVGPSNFSACKARLIDVIARCRSIGFHLSAEEEAKLLSDLRVEFEKAVRADLEREEQARIKSQIREEERLKREIERELRQLEREKLAIQAALDQALAEAQGRHSVQVEQLQKRLAEAEAKSQRAMSMAQQTKAGNVYVISNIGSFGEGVFKIGMTRRLEPKDRVRELGDASVPFPFDIHMMIKCEDAPALENALHRIFHKSRLNRANPRKEFFRATIAEIHQAVIERCGEVVYTVDPEALEYRQSLTMPEEDAEFIERVFEAAEEEEGTATED